MARRVKASEIVLAERTRDTINRSLAPIDAWRAIENPQLYLDSLEGKCLAGMEMLLERAVAEHDFDRTFQVLTAILRMTKLGRAKAELTVAGSLNKLRQERDLSKIDTEKLKEILGEH